LEPDPNNHKLEPDPNNRVFPFKKRQGQVPV
jgi:hypothetical protein